MCDVATAISAGVGIFSATRKQRGNAAAEIGAWLQQEQAIMERPLRQAQVASGVRAIARGERLAEAEEPLQHQVIGEAEKAGSAAEQDLAATRAVADTRAALDATGGERVRSLRSLGIDPSSGAALAGSRAAQAADAATLAKAATDAREGEYRRGQEQRIRVAGQARGFNPNVSTLSDPGGSLVKSGSTLANIDATNREAQANQLNTIGNVAGQIAGKLQNREPAPSYVPNSDTGASTSIPAAPNYNELDFEHGGPVNGPSHAGGGVPIEAEGGEYVIRADTAKKYGARLLSEVNEGTAIIIPTGKPRKLAQVG